MNKNLMSLVFLLITSAVQKFTTHKGAYQEITRLQMEMFYLRSIKTCRLLFLSTVGLGVFLILILGGLILFHISFFLYAPCSAESKMWVGFAFAVVYLLIAAKVFYSVFSEEKWLSMFQAENILKETEETPSG